MVRMRYVKVALVAISLLLLGKDLLQRRERLLIERKRLAVGKVISLLQTPNHHGLHLALPEKTKYFRIKSVKKSLRKKSLGSILYPVC